MAVIIKVNPIQIKPFQGSKKLRVERGYKKSVDVRKMRLGKRLCKQLKNNKIEHKFNQILLTSTIIIGNF